MQHTIAVIGGTGKAGQFLVKSLEDRGVNTRLLLRKNGHDVCRYEDVYDVLTGCTAVLSTLGQPKGAPPIFEKATANILRAMEAHGIRRYIAVTGLSINVPGDKKSLYTRMRAKMMKAMFPGIIRSKQLEYRLLAKSNADWTLIRLPFIVQANITGALKVSETDCLGKKVYAAALADFMIAQLDDKRYIKRAPFVASE
ncbi:NAD(P)H-binding protein [Chitinophaga sedimenti]|uniref:NAD(P)-dependent oxidoreductase n=1 Tax=Chitinophaga sedimenti TaxID=2033606 RepID=UPI002004177D|nr:NAD(P)H-binding protein [Chitinophaga sedimenti]MCK7554438.1 NAD(P)H-binding protein [Chitinophaga sedimenti]